MMYPNWEYLVFLSLLHKVSEWGFLCSRLALGKPWLSSCLHSYTSMDKTRAFTHNFCAAFCKMYNNCMVWICVCSSKPSSSIDTVDCSEMSPLLYGHTTTVPGRSKAVPLCLFSLPLGSWPYRFKWSQTSTHTKASGGKFAYSLSSQLKFVCIYAWVCTVEPLYNGHFGFLGHFCCCIEVFLFQR